jgi:hypothetical protein
VATPAVASAVAKTPSPEHERAVALSNEGDATVKVNVDGAIEKHAEALWWKPDNVDVSWKVSRACENQRLNSGHCRA